ncbi:MAG: hypothetical protein LBH10_07155 [Burkholderiaceae bacterium]|jgi:hypothetical protein|nr:hypothetical protein [Burkholderiaceae bacterium]
MKTPVLSGIVITAWLVMGHGAWAQSANGGPNADKPPMQAQELARLVPKDASQSKSVDISRQGANNVYRYDKSGVNCSLYPARCRGENY